MADRSLVNKTSYLDAKLEQWNLMVRTELCFVLHVKRLFGEKAKLFIINYSYFDRISSFYCHQLVMTSSLFTFCRSSSTLISCAPVLSRRHLLTFQMTFQILMPNNEFILCCREIDFQEPYLHVSN